MTGLNFVSIVGFFAVGGFWILPIFGARRSPLAQNSAKVG